MITFRIAVGLAILLAFLALVGWLVWRSIKNSVDPAGMIFRYVVSVGLLIGGIILLNKTAGADDPLSKVFGIFIGLFLAMIVTFLWGPTVLGKIGDLVGGLFTGGNTPPEPVPLYSTAESRRKQGRYQEALWEIQGQLAKFPNDVVGQMMIAEIQAENMNDLAGAQVTIERFCAQPGHGPKNIAFALNSLADWHLKYNQDLEAARAAVQRIIDLTADTETAMHAAQRLAHLADDSAMAAVRERKPIPMRSGAMNVGLRAESASLRPQEESPEDTAARLVKELEAHPLNAEVREKLARLYSEHFQSLDLAVDQLEQLINAPHQPGKDVARWLNTIADLQVKHNADYDTICATLQRIIDLFPGLAAEQMARQRIDHLRLEMKANDPSHALKLGTYEKDLGLKLRKPH
jgi:tetratricopeptide (TPR) repeat protein